MNERIDPDHERTRLLDAARALLVEEGTAGLSVRRVAKAAGCSTMGVYTRFGGKPGLLDALYAEGYAEWASAQAEVEGPPSSEGVLALCLIHRRFALARPAHYALMTGQVPGFTPSGANAGLAQAARRRLYLEIAGAHARKEIDVADAVGFVDALLGACHGLIILERGGFGQPVPTEATYRATVRALLVGWGR